MIFTPSRATQPFNGRVVGLLETELHGFLELGYMDPLESKLRGSLTSELPGFH